MALLPTIPTSFVPRTASSDRSSVRSVVSSSLGVFAYALFALALVMAVSVFFYARIQNANKSAKDAALAKAEAAIDPVTVNGFVQLRNRLAGSEKLLDSHLALSGFFPVLDALLPGVIRFSSLHISVDATGATTVEGSGVSKSFNALLASSQTFAADGRIKNIIFSRLGTNKDKSVSFNFSATVDPKIVSASSAPTNVAPTLPPPTNASSTLP